MKTIPNKTTALNPLTPNGGPILYSDLLRMCLDFPPPDGFDMETLRKRMRVELAIADCKMGDEIKLEDADFETAKVAVRNVRWKNRSAEYITFAELFAV